MFKTLLIGAMILMVAPALMVIIGEYIMGKISDWMNGGKLI